MKEKYYLYSMNSAVLNIVALSILAFMIIMTEFIMGEYSIDVMLTMILIVPYFCFHEVLHSIAYVINGANFKHITYGVHLEKGILCCLCKEDVSKKNILTSLLFPFIFIGVITYIIGIICNSGVLLILSICNISGCAGDLVMFFDLVRLKDFRYAEYDNPMAFGIKSKIDISQKRLFGLKYIETRDVLEQTDFKKVRISKISMVVLIIFFIALIINIFL